MAASKIVRREKDESLFRDLPLPLAQRISFFLSPLKVANAATLTSTLEVYPLPYLSVELTVPKTSNELDVFATIVSDNAPIVLDVFLHEPRGEHTKHFVKLLLRSKLVEALRLRDANASPQLVECLSAFTPESRNSCHLFHFCFTNDPLVGSLERVATCLGDVVQNDSHLSCLDIKNFGGVEFPTFLLKACGLLEGIKRSSSLRYLRIVDAGLDPEAAILIAGVLASNKTIEYVGLGSNPIGDIGISALAQSLELNNTLKVLMVAHIGATGKGGKALAHSLCRNYTLRQLFLKDDGLGADCGYAFAAMLKVNRSLQFLCLDYCDLQPEGCRHFTSAIFVNRSLKVLRLNHNWIAWKDQIELIRTAEEGGTLRVLELSDKNLLAREASHLTDAQQFEPWNISYASHILSRGNGCL